MPSIPRLLPAWLHPDRAAPHLQSDERSSILASRMMLHFHREAWLQPGLAILKERGYDHADWPQLDVKLLSKELAIASALIVRYKSDNAEFGRAGVTYLMRKVEDRFSHYARHCCPCVAMGLATVPARVTAELLG